MKRSPLKSGKPLARRARLAPKRAPPRRSTRAVDTAYLAWVRTLVCCARDLSPCEGGTEADHAAKKVGGGRKSDDRGAIALCRGHHRQRHTFNGPFRAWTAPRMRAWLDAQIAGTRAAIAAAASLNTTAPSADHSRA